MSSLANELLNDLDDGAEEEEEEQQDASNALPNPLKRKAGPDEMDEDEEDEEDEKPTLEGGVAPGGIAPAQELDEEEVAKMDMATVEDVRNVAKLEGSKRMMEVLQVRSIRVDHSHSSLHVLISSGH